jgi:ADP-ribosyl-[dinitrogen reductase] hydrolase
MFGAIVGDIAGSKYEFNNLRSKDFPLFSEGCDFTDDTVMTIAVANALHTYRAEKSLTAFRDEVASQMRKLGREYPGRGYGGRFAGWLADESMGPYNSLGNGSAMRVSPVAWAAGSIEEAETLAKVSAEPTHNHPEGIKGAQAVAAAIYMGRIRKSKKEIRNYIEEKYYKLDFTLDEIRPAYKFNATCPGSVPQAIEAFLESESFEDAIRNAVSIGGDSDTIAAIAGSIAEAFYGEVPADIKNKAMSYLSEELRICCGIFAAECDDSQDAGAVMGEFLTNILHVFGQAAAEKKWLSSEREIIYIKELWETGQRFVAYWLSNKQFVEHYNGDVRDMYYNISTISMLSGMYYALSYNIDSENFNADAIFKELFTGNIFDTVAAAVTFEMEDIQGFINEQYKELYTLIDSFAPDGDTLEKLLYQGACAFFQIGCSIELHDLGAGL